LPFPLRDPKVQQPNFPVVNVNWKEAADYCQKVDGRLPTEAEWEYAARGRVEGQIYPWGNTADSRKANYFRANNQKPQPAGTFPPNRGLYDMAGNVYEWVYDYYDPSYYENPKPAIDPTGPTNGTDHVKRGGSWDSPLDRVRISARGHFDPKKRDDQTGFRCVIDNIRTP